MPDLFELELVPIGLDVAKGPGTDEAELLTFFKKRNKVRLGAPQFVDYSSSLVTAGSSVPADIVAGIGNGERFQHVRPTATLLPDIGCTFISLEVSVELFSSSDGEGSRPIAYYVRPLERVEELPYVIRSATEYELANEINPGLAKLTARIANERSYEEHGKHYLRWLYGYGTNYSEVGWRYQAVEGHELVGDLTDLEFVARLAREKELWGRFSVTTEIAIETALDRWLTWTFGPRQQELALRTLYSLS